MMRRCLTCWPAISAISSELFSQDSTTLLSCTRNRATTMLAVTPTVRRMILALRDMAGDRSLFLDGRAVLAQFVVEGFGRDAEDFRCFFLIVFRMHQRYFDQLALGLIDGGADRKLNRG